jgi:hypothetical protein
VKEGKMAKAILPALNRHFFPVRKPRHVQVDGVLASPAPSAISSAGDTGSRDEHASKQAVERYAAESVHHVQSFSSGPATSTLAKIFGDDPDHRTSNYHPN